MNRKPIHPNHVRRGERGAALIIALIMLIMVSLLAAAGFLLTTSEARGAIGWSDRQRALFTAEGALTEGVAAAKAIVNSDTLTTSESSVAERVRAAGTGFFVRTDGTVPDLNPWPDSQSVEATAKDANLTSKIHYIVVYEGSGVSSGSALVTGNGNTNKSSIQPRFTVYAQSGGIKDGTNVVLSTTTAF